MNGESFCSRSQFAVQKLSDVERGHYFDEGIPGSVENITDSLLLYDKGIMHPNVFSRQLL